MTRSTPEIVEERKEPARESARLATRATSFSRRDRSARRFDLDRLEEELSDPERFCWIDIQDPEIGPLNDLLKRLGMNLVLTSHFEAPEVLPRVVELTDCLCFTLYEVEDPERHLDTGGGLRELELVRMIVVLGLDFVVTYHRKDVDAVAYVTASSEESFRLWGKTPGFIAFLFLQRCLYDYAHLNLANDNYLDHLEGRVLGGDRTQLSADISLASRNILTLKKLAASLHIVLMLLATKRSLFISDEARAFYHEMLQTAATVRAAVDSSRDMLDGIVASVQSRAAQRTADIARVLTVVSTVVLPLTLIAGVYGMNFRNMPELATRWGYYAVLAGMAVVGGGMLAAFWRLGWLGRDRSRG